MSHYVNPISPTLKFTLGIIIKVQSTFFVLSLIKHKIKLTISRDDLDRYRGLGVVLDCIDS